MISEIIDCDNETARSLENIEKLIFGTAWNYEIIQEKIKNKKFKYWIYEVENSIKGYLGIQFLEEEIEILGIGVNQGSRRKNIATELMDELIEYFEKTEYKKIILEVRESNTVAQRLYKKYGFKKISKRKKYYVDDSDNECQPGHKVSIIECQPKSKLKRWRLNQIEEKAIDS